MYLPTVPILWVRVACTRTFVHFFWVRKLYSVRKAPHEMESESGSKSGLAQAHAWRWGEGEVYSMSCMVVVLRP